MEVFLHSWKTDARIVLKMKQFVRVFIEEEIKDSVMELCRL